MGGFFNTLNSLLNNENLMSAALGAVIGGIVTFMSEMHFRKSDDKEQVKHYASILYYDLKSIEYYVLHEASSVDIRYCDDWQSLVINCSFLSSEDVRYIYSVYDLIYNFDFLFQRYKDSGMSNRKEDQPAYKELQKCFQKDNSSYNEIMKKLEKKIKLKNKK